MILNQPDRLHPGLLVVLGWHGCHLPNQGGVHQTRDGSQVYLHADTTIKERALARVQPPDTSPGRYRPPDALLMFLTNL